jgi:hypothetical protein
MSVFCYADVRSHHRYLCDRNGTHSNLINGNIMLTENKNTSPAFGVYSEVGKLKKVMVCSPGMAHERLTRGTVTVCCLTMFCG